MQTLLQPLEILDLQPGIRVVFGPDSLEWLPTLSSEFNVKRILLVTDPDIEKAGHAQRAAQLLESNAEIHVFDDVDENPTTVHVKNGVEFAKLHGPLDLIVAIGGGSAMDCAKAINFLLTNGGRMEDYWGAEKASKPMLPSIGIPTTAGTGSEAQSYALIEQETTHIKMACGDKKAKFRAVILDPRLTVTMPGTVTATSGIDAVTHSIESYVSLRRNPFSQMYAQAAWRLLDANYETVLKAPGNLEARGNMLLASHFAGTAIEYSMLGAAHACANPLSARYGTAHGVAVGLMLPHVIRFNAPVVQHLYRELVQLMGVSPSDTNDSERLASRVLQMSRAGSLPSRLRDCNVEAAAIPELAREATKQWTGTFNPRPLTEKDFIDLYEAAF
jgi:alcohol dehydrogenase